MSVGRSCSVAPCGINDRGSVMNLSPVIPASQASAPADGARATEPSGESGFDNVLAQQKGHTARRTAATPAANGSSAPGQSTESDEIQAQTPEETLALLAAGAVLPWPIARNEISRASRRDQLCPYV